MSEKDTKASPLGMWLGILLFGLLGALMLAHGLGLYDASWFNPNPDVPPLVFTAIGVMVLATIPLMLAQVIRLPRRFLNVMGWALVLLAFGLAHWLVFFAEGASCSLDGITLALGLPDFLCTGLFGLVLIACDLLLLAVLFSRIRPPRKLR
jgi:hypothetical protein